MKKSRSEAYFFNNYLHNLNNCRLEVASTIQILFFLVKVYLREKCKKRRKSFVKMASKDHSHNC